LSRVFPASYSQTEEEEATLLQGRGVPGDGGEQADVQEVPLRQMPKERDDAR